VTVCVPEYVARRWWEHLLHNQSALRLKARLLFEPGVMVTSVPGSCNQRLDLRHPGKPDRSSPPLTTARSRRALP
jgi:hypothetical protein